MQELCVCNPTSWNTCVLISALTVLGGQKISGADIRDQNGAKSKASVHHLIRLICHLVLATQAIANVVKSSFGPSGLDKMMVDDIGVGYLL